MHHRNTPARPIPRAVAWIGVLIAVLLIASVLSVLLTGCGDPCASHGGTINLNKGLYTCADGTIA